ncbi:Protein argonaute-1 [Araneus ventricosus]|uniref:Protein argonaute-1 n=1 Tax=Araneus ventricosus TaxID=182803 RepID=A0A4Y2SA18_ARAVE|nr:Protein argonaute-1 [Araneus ventricosus]GBN84780.1 Protein argonaute-1 [Araneus ventricosus]GBN84792.1 Protein argonaute-1 [Araneus ventricosus]GBN85042.1 Protein argonaute-1 [Araneus ventricosus]
MPRKKGKKKSSPEDAPGPGIPGLSSVCNVPSSSSREQPPASARGSGQRPREQAAAPAQLPRQPEPSGPGRSRQDAPDSEVPGRTRMRDDPSSSGEQRPSASGPSDRQLSQQFRELALVPAMPRKPKQPGRLGRAISLISNLYPLKFSGCHVYHYDVEIARLGASYTEPSSGTSPDSSRHKDGRKKYKCLNTKLNRKVFRKLCIENFEDSLAVFDGEKNMYCMEPLHIEEEGTFEVRIEAENPGDPGDPRGPRMDVFEVRIKPVEKKETGDNVISLEPLNALFRGQTTSVPLEAVMVLETVLRYVPCLRFVPVGRNFFSPPDSKHPLGNGKEVWFGHHQSVRLAQKTAVVNLNLSASSFYESIPVIEYIEKLTGKNLRQVAGLDREDVIKVNKDIKNICVETTHLPYRRKYRVDGLSDLSANKKKFKIPEGNREVEVTVEHYYRTRYDVRLKYPHLLCLKVKNKDSCLPMEVCEIARGQHSSKELNPKQQAEMIKYTAQPPHQRFGEIENVYKNSDYDNDPFLRKFGLRVLDKPLKVDGRTMEAPNVIYKRNSHEFRERPRNGAWNMRDKQFFTGTRIDRWTLLSFARKEECHYGKLKQFAGALERFANEQGVEMNACSHIEIAEAKLQNIHFCIKNMKSQFNAQLIFVVLPTEKQRVPGKSEKLSQALYSEVKRVAETNIGIVTQCVKGENVVSKGTNPSFVSNLCLKMNAKMGGVNNSMVPAEVSMQPQEQILFVGADVNHPAPTENTCYSLAAAVGSVDGHPSRYAVIVRPQKNDENYKKMVEVILNMQEMMRKLLLAYYANTRMKPKKIIVYRDGVSDGQFADVQAREIEWIRAACTGLEAGYRPGITFIVIQKRHNVRFLDARGNPPPGTVVDTTVTHPLNYDFYLYSHSGMKGKMT